MAESLTLPKQVIKKPASLRTMRFLTAILILSVPLAAQRHPAIEILCVARLDKGTGLLDSHANFGIN